MKLSAELKNLPIVSIAEGEEVGMVKDFIVDPVGKSVVALVIADSSWYAGAKVISFSLINSIGDYAITTENSSSVVELTNMPELIDLLKRELKINDARIITRGGRFIGRVREYSIDEKTGNILGLELSSDSEILAPDKNVIPADAIVTIGKDVIIVNDDVEVRLKTDHSELIGGAAVSRPSAPKPAAPKTSAKPEPPKPKIPEFIQEPEYSETSIEEDLGLEPAGSEPDVPVVDDVEVDIEKLLELDVEAESSGLIDQPAERAARTAPAPRVEEETRESLGEIFERRQIKYMLGKKVSRDIETDDGILIASQGQTIDDNVIQKAKKAGKFLELSMNIEIEE